MPKTAVITSDLHYGITSPRRISALKEEMMKAGPPDVVILAGDIGEPVPNFEGCIEVFSDLGCPVGVIIGNHDLYNTGSGFSSEELWSRVLRGLVRKYGLVWMEEETITVGRVAFVGSLAWYDYSSRSRRYADLDEDFYQRHKARFVSDGRYIDWVRRDTDFARELLSGLVRRLERAEEDPHVERIVVVTHVPLFPEQMSHERGDDPHADAYFGNFTAGMAVRRFSKVTDVVSGHTHRGVDTVKDGTRLVVVPSHYGRPAFVSLAF